MKNFLSPVLIILAGIIVYFYIMPMYAFVGALGEKHNELKTVLASTQSLEARIAEIESEYQSFSGTERGLLMRLVPQSVNEHEVVTEITTMALARGMTVADVGFEPAVEEGRQKIDVEAAASKPYQEWHMTVTLEGPYEGFISLLGDLGRSIRITDVSEINITPAARDEAAISYTITATIYSLE